jgi:tRNA threonylcarbamoyl adenosine modification protein YeaZ
MPDPLAAPAAGAGSVTLVIATGHDLSLALLHGDKVAASHHESMQKGHAEALVPAIAALLAPFGGAAHRCDRILVETGPGSFTGLRVGLAAARALALAWGAEVRGVRSTQLVAAEIREQGVAGPLLVALAAPRGQVWVEGFGAGAVRPPEALLPDDALALARTYPAVAGTALLAEAQTPLPPRAAAARALAMTELGEADILYVSAPAARDDIRVPG